jgi:VanZ family protein
MSSKWFRSGCIAAAFFMAAMLFLGADEAGKIPLFPAPWDKLAHFLYYGTMAVLLAHGVGRRRLWIPLLAVPLVGVLDEWHQLYVPGRESSVFDWMADVVGTGVGVWAARRAGKSRDGRDEVKGKGAA